MKRSGYLEPLSHDHHNGLVVAARLERALRDGTRQDLLADYVGLFWRVHLDRHFGEEEAWLLPLLNDSESVRGLGARMVDEHRRIRGLVAALADEAGGAPDFSEPLAEFAQLLKAHIRFEERELFPAIEEHAPDEVLAEVARHLDERDDSTAETVSTETRALVVARATRDACASAAADAFEEAGIAGLCRDGAIENAVSAIRLLDVEEVIAAAGRNS